MKKGTNVLIILIVLLLVISVVFIGLIFYQKDRAIPDRVSDAPSQPPIPVNGSITPPINDFGSLPSPPDPGASEEERVAFFQQVSNLAQDSNQLEIESRESGCGFSPAVARVKEDSLVTFINGTSIKRRITITEDIVISAGSQKAISATFKNGPGVYTLRCDGFHTGFLIVEAV